MNTRMPRTRAVLLALAALALLPTPDAAQQNTHGTRAPAQVPEGHPRLGNPAHDAVPTVAPESGTGTDALVWQSPEGWLSEPPSSNMRRAQYRVPGAGGDATCVVYYFGPGQGGDAMSNAQRWGDQFGQPDGRRSSEVLETEWIEVNRIRVLLAETTGIYSGGMTTSGRPAGSTLSEYMLLGAVAEGPDANWFFKLTGPVRTVESTREAFRSMIDSLARGTAPAGD